MRNAPLQTEIKDGQLVISIGVDTLCHAVSIGRSYGMGEITVSNNDVFANELLNELNDESEDGSTAVHRMLDDAASQAIENGADDLRIHWINRSVYVKRIGLHVPADKREKERERIL